MGIPSKTSDEIAAELRSEIRSIFRLRRELTAPLDEFQPFVDSSGCTRFYVCFDKKPRIRFNGLRLASLQRLGLPDESIEDKVFEYAKAVWHLKDRLHQFAKQRKLTNCNLDTVVTTSRNLQIASDLANEKKHGRNKNRSGLKPKLDLIRLDTSECGNIEIFYDGATKETALIVEKPVPIHFDVDVVSEVDGSRIADAREIVFSAFQDWMSTINDLKLLSSGDPESIALKTMINDSLRNTT